MEDNDVGFMVWVFGVGQGTQEQMIQSSFDPLYQGCAGVKMPSPAMNRHWQVEIPQIAYNNT